MIDFFYNKFFNINNIGGGNPKKDFFFLSFELYKKTNKCFVYCTHNLYMHNNS